MDRSGRDGREVISSKDFSLPDLICHADWSTNPAKRWMAIACRTENGEYSAQLPILVGEPTTLLYRLRDMAGAGAAVLVGFDFPIGLPLKYASKVGVGDFLDALPNLGRGRWKYFFSVAETAEAIGLFRPFYPSSPGGRKHRDLIQALGVTGMADLLRKCDLAHAGRRAASPLFWTLGAQQVGKAAIHGWKEVLVPGIRDKELDLALWPFSGQLMNLLRQGRTILAETYPAEVYTHLGISFSMRRPGKKSGKRVQADRAANGGRLIDWAEQTGVSLAGQLRSGIGAGFGSAAGGEDLFDACVGLFGMLNVILGNRPTGEPEDPEVRNVEGWILGQGNQASPASGQKVIV